MATRPRHGARLLGPAGGLLALVAGVGVAAQDVRFVTSFDGPTPLAGFRFSEPAAWRVGRAGDEHCLELVRNSDYAPPQRSPRNLAVLPTPPVAGFTLELDVASTNAAYAHQDLCIFLGIESPRRYVYLHLGRQADETSHHVMLVDNADRRPITTERTRGVDWGPPGTWHRVRVVLDAAKRRVAAYVDDMTAPVLVANDVPIISGHVGLGSFDDTGRFDDIRLEGDAAGTARPTLFGPKRAGGWTLRPLVTLSDDGGWCWFEGERAIVTGNELLVGAVAAGSRDRFRRGDIELIRHDLTTGRTSIVELDDRLELDDHDSPALVVRQDGSVLAMWSRHGPESRIYVRHSIDDLDTWSPRRTVTLSPASRITYSNLFRLSQEQNRIYDFFRGLDGRWKPSVIWSDDGGITWTTGNVVIDVPATRSHRPYVRYASDGRARIDLFYTEGHPRDYDNSVYHVYYQDGHLHRSDGTPVATLEAGLARPEDGTRVFAGDADHVAWVVDARLDENGRPVVVYSVQVGGAGLPPGKGGDDHRYRVARWDGAAWRDHALAYAGSRLYAGEDDYTGLAAVDPDDGDTVYLSTDADPATGAPLVSRADGRRHHEIFRARTADDGMTWSFTALTRDSTVDNLRPVVPKWRSDQTAVLWLRGTYTSYTAYDLDVVLMRPDEAE